MERCFLGAAAVVVGLSLAPVPAAGQAPTATPTVDAAGKPATFTPSRTPDGQPDIQGYWEGGAGFTEEGVDRPAVRPGPDIATNKDCAVGRGGLEANTECAAYVPLFTGVIDGKLNYGKGADQSSAPSRPRGFVDVPGGRLPWTAAGEARRTALMKNLFNPPTLEYVDPSVRCLASWRGGGQQFLQVPGHVVILQEAYDITRIIPVDGRPHVGQNIRRPQGDSVGRWEGNTLVVDTTNFAGGGWWDMTGSAPQSDALHLIERFTIVDANTIDYVVTVDDPKMFTRPWSFQGSFRRAESAKEQGVETIEILEHACAEGSRALENTMERPDKPLPPEKLLPR